MNKDIFQKNFQKKNPKEFHTTQHLFEPEIYPYIVGLPPLESMY